MRHIIIIIILILILIIIIILIFLLSLYKMIGRVISVMAAVLPAVEVIGPCVCVCVCVSQVIRD